VKEQEQYDSIIYYDGDCGFCNSTVQFVLNKRKSHFYFCPLQSKLAQKRLKKFDTVVNFDTIYFEKGNKVYERSSAAFQISKGLKGLYPTLIIFYIVPRFIRDAVYNAIAKRRHQLRSGYCVIPEKADQKWFIGTND
jgi:predicted DCC family thiol-disulfide oxidoreductase YuxK